MKGETYTYIGKKLKILRTMFDLTQKEFASVIGVVPQQYQKYETGVNKISIEKLKMICDKYKVDIMCFMVEDKEKDKEIKFFK